MSLETLSQSDFDFNLENPDWVALKLVLRKLDEEMADRRKHLLRKVANWFLALDLFREFADNRMVVAEPSMRDREFFRVFLTNLLAQGETLLLDLKRQTEVDPGKMGLDQADVAANVQYLRDEYAMHCMEMRAERREEILGEVFR